MPEEHMFDALSSVHAEFFICDRAWSIVVAGMPQDASKGRSKPLATNHGKPGESFGDVLDGAIVKLREVKQLADAAVRAA